MNPEEFLLTAAGLLSSERESDHRSCVSRAYYAVYHVLRIALLRHFSMLTLQNSGLGDKKNIPHDRLAQVLRRSTNPTISKMGEDLLELKRARNSADYGIEERLAKAKAQLLYNIAIKLRNDLKAFGVDKLVTILKTEIEASFPSR